MVPAPTTTTTTTTTTMAPAEQAGYSTNWPGFTLDEFKFECQSPFDEVGKIDHLPASEKAHLVIFGSCHGSIIGQRSILTSHSCCENAVGQTVILNDGKTHVVNNVRSDETVGLCVMEIPTQIILNSNV